MEKDNKKRDSTASEKSLSELLRREAGKKKSIRTTFTLTNEGIEVIEELREAFGFTLKKFVDILCEGLPIQGDFKLKQGAEIPLMHEVIKVAKKMTIDKSKFSNRKTMVISERAQNALNNISKFHKIPRDVLIDEGFKFLLSKIKKILEDDDHSKRQKALDIVGHSLAYAEQNENELKRILDKDDPILKKYSLITTQIMILHSEIYDELNKGVPIPLTWAKTDKSQPAYKEDLEEFLGEDPSEIFSKILAIIRKKEADDANN